MTLPVLYILMRNDLSSMNAGKAMAQASHASNAFVKSFYKSISNFNDENLSNAFYEWENSTAQGFGTVLVLEAPYKDIEPRIDMFKQSGYLADIINDPTYPLLDGSVVHYISLNTCAYVFVPDKNTDILSKMLLCSFPLHK